jgi:uncharacterized membrane protein YtjA (UPF0391 family)
MTGSAAVASAVLVQPLGSELPMQVFSGDFLELAVLFFVLAIVAAVFGARGVAGLSMEIAKWLVVIFIVLAVVSAIL